MATSKSKTDKVAQSKASTQPVTHPSWIDMIKECIAENKKDVRSGVSRSRIKKYAEDTYHLEIGAAQTSQLSRAIKSGVERNIFALPKGPSGCVKLAPKQKPAERAESEEPVKPRSKTTTKAANPVKKSAAGTSAPKKAAATKKTPALTKKVLAGKPKAAAITKKTTSKPSGAKKAVTGTSAASKAKASAKKLASSPKKVKATKKPVPKSTNKKTVKLT